VQHGSIFGVQMTPSSPTWAFSCTVSMGDGRASSAAGSTAWPTSYRGYSDTRPAGW